MAQPSTPSGRISSSRMATTNEVTRKAPGSRRATLTWGGFGATAPPTMSMKAAPHIMSR